MPPAMISMSQSTSSLSTNQPLAHPSSTSNPVSALIAGRATLVAPPSLSTVNHSDNLSNTRVQRLPGRSIHVSHRIDLQQALSPPTAAVPVSTRENISTSKTWTTSSPLVKSLSQPPLSNNRLLHGFAIHPSFRNDADHRGDVLVRVGSVEFYVHKHILRFASPFFASILEGEWKESRLSQYIESSSDSEDEPEESARKDHTTCTDQDKQKPAISTSLAADSMATTTTTTSQAPFSSRRSIDSSVSEADSEDVCSLVTAEDTDRNVSNRNALRASYHTARVASDEDEAVHSEPYNHTSEDPTVHKLSEPPTGLMPANPSAATRRRSFSLGSSPDKAHRSKLQTSITRDHTSTDDAKLIPTRKSSNTFKLNGASSSRDADSEPSSPFARFESLATPPISPRQSSGFTDGHRSSAKLQNRAKRNKDQHGSTSSTRPAAAAAATTATATTTTRHTTKDRIKKARARETKVIAVIDLEEETASTFHDFLFHIYPHLDLSVTWWNCGPLLRFADKFQVPFLKRSCVGFLKAALAGRPIEAMRLAELHRLDDLYKEASRHVLDNFALWEPEELGCLSKETLLKLERKRTWFLERLLKLGLCNPARDYECHSNCPDPQTCAKTLHERWQLAYSNAFRFSPPQPSVIFRHLRELDGAPFLPMSACQSTARCWVQLLFDRMFSLGTLHTPRQFLSIKLDSQVARNMATKEV